LCYFIYDYFLCEITNDRLGLDYLFNTFLVYEGISSFHIKLFKWVSFEYCDVYFGFIFNNYIIIMLSVVIIISSLVHIYSFSYMSQDPHFIKFIGYLSLFTFFMIILVTAPNLLQFFIG
jgi:NADH-ubiquinone oxidoreductase chain 5